MNNSNIATFLHLSQYKNILMRQKKKVHSFFFSFQLAGLLKPCQLLSTEILDSTYCPFKGVKDEGGVQICLSSPFILRVYELEKSNKRVNRLPLED